MSDLSRKLAVTLGGFVLSGVSAGCTIFLCLALVQVGAGVARQHDATRKAIEQSRQQQAVQYRTTVQLLRRIESKAEPAK